jgi:glucose/arabinose dehydrogenase
MSIAQIPTSHPWRRFATLAVCVALLGRLAGLAPAPARGAVTLGLVSYKTGFSQPVAIANAGDGSGRLFVVEQAGRVRIITRAGTLRSTPFIDIRSRVACCGERGLLGMAFHPSYRTNGRFYLAYTDSTGALVVGEYRRSSSSANRASTTERRIIRIPHSSYSNHNGGQLAFGPDGYLYIGTGDGGGGGDPLENGQRRSTLLGKILRIAPNVTSASPRYRVPSTNPWATSTTIRHEIWAYGVRNPWRFSFDRRTGDLWVADVGQGTYEEVNRSRRAVGGGRGANFGWDQYEAFRCHEGPCSSSGKTFPLAYYAHGANGCSVTGGYVYRGSAIPALRGFYLFADFASGHVWAKRGPGGARRVVPGLDGQVAQIASFGQDARGELYVVSLAGSVFKIVP